MRIFLLLFLILLLGCAEESNFILLQGTSNNGGSTFSGNATDTIFLSTYCDASPCDVMYWVTQT